MSQSPDCNPATPTDQATYWNEQGGEKWVQNLDHIDRMIGGFNSHLFSAAAPRSGEKVLDVGCGGGTTGAALAQLVGTGGQVVGVDISAVILEAARIRQAEVGNLRLELGDAASFEFEPGYFDLITSRFGVMFFDAPTKAFGNLRAALKPDGRITFICWRALAENPWMAAPAEAAFEILPRPEPPDPHAPGPFSLADPDKLTTLLETAGFNAVRIDPIEEVLNLGPPEGALDFLKRMGPAATPLQEASEADAQAAINAIEAVLSSFLRDGEVYMPGAVWLVSAGAA